MPSGLNILREFYKTTKVDKASRTETGATEVGSRTPKEPADQASLIPAVAMIAAVGIIVAAWLLKAPNLGNRRLVPLDEQPEPNDENSDAPAWQTREPGW